MLDAFSLFDKPFIDFYLPQPKLTRAKVQIVDIDLIAHRQKIRDCKNKPKPAQVVQAGGNLKEQPKFFEKSRVDNSGLLKKMYTFNAYGYASMGNIGNMPEQSGGDAKSRN